MIYFFNSQRGFDRWLIDNSANSSSISCVDTYDMTNNGSKNLILGRQDGSIEVFIININDKLDAPVIIYSHVSYVIQWKEL